VSEQGEFGFELLFKSAVTGDTLAGLDITLTRRDQGLGVPAPIQTWICAESMVRFMAEHSLRATVIYTLTRAGLAWVKPFRPEEP
jgi:hypothetical protein